jgi:hypothetical protein
MVLRRKLFLLSLAVAIPAALTFAPAGMAAQGCSGDPGQPAPESVGGWSLRVCLNVPDNGGAITANFPTITANPEFSGGSGSKPRIQRMIFTLTGQGDDPDHDLLTDFTRNDAGNFTFVFPRQAYDGGTNLRFAVRAMMTGATNDTGTLAFVDLSFVGARQPLDPSFTVRKNGGRAPSASSPYVVAVTGDGAGGEASAGRVLRLIRSWNPNLLLYTGDVYNNGTQAEYYNHYGLSGRLWGRLRERTIPTIGNHESFYKPYGSEDGFGYFNYWFGNDTSAGNHHFAVDAHRGWHMVSLDSTRAYLGPAGGAPAADDQISFLESTLEANRTGCALVLYHHPLFTRGPETFTPEDGQRLRPIWRTLASRGADLVLNGHDHNYQHWKRLNANGAVRRNGTAEFVVGSGGHGIEQRDRPPDGRLIKMVDREGTFGALRLVLNRHGAEYRYVTVDGRTRDIGVLPCSNRRPDRQDNTRPTPPTRLSARHGSVKLKWRASTDVGGVGVTKYRVYRNGRQIGSTKHQTFVDRRAPRGFHRYFVKAVDFSGNVSRKSNSDGIRVR